MAKLKCERHNRRVVAINGKFIHRCGTGDACTSQYATIREQKLTAREASS